MAFLAGSKVKIQHINTRLRTYIIAYPSFYYQTNKWIVFILNHPLLYFIFIWQLVNKSCFIVSLRYRHISHLKDFGRIFLFSMCSSRYHWRWRNILCEIYIGIFQYTASLYKYFRYNNVLLYVRTWWFRRILICSICKPINTL